MRSRLVDSMIEHRIPSAEEAASLARRAQRGDRRAREQLLRLMSRWALLRARKFARHAPQHQDDLFQEALRGLDRGIDGFEQGKASFLTYADYWIGAYCRRYLATHASDIRVPADAHSKTIRSVERLLGDSGRCGDAARALAPHVRLDAPARRSEPTGTTTRGDFLASGSTPEEALEEAEQAAQARARLERALEVLDRRELAVVRRRLLVDGDPETLAKVGESFDCSRERVRQIELAALKKLLRALRSSATPRQVFAALGRAA